MDRVKASACGVMTAMVLGVAGSASGALVTLDLKVSRDGIEWFDTIGDFSSGDTVKCAIFMGSDGSQFIYGMGGATARLTGTGLETNDSVAFAAGTATGRVTPFNFGAATNAIYRTAGGFRIDAASDPGNSNTGAGMTFFQRDPASGGASFQILPQGGPGSKVFEFEIVLGASSEVYLVTMGLDQLSRGVASYYTSASSTRPATTGDVALDGARFWVNVPTPGAMAMMGLGLLVAGRRRGR
jgi:MYXO-CTERM domain-containing protein